MRTPSTISRSGKRVRTRADTGSASFRRVPQQQLLNNAGWVEGTDYRIEGGSIAFFGVSKLDSGTDDSHLKSNGSTDSKGVPYEPLDLSVKPRKKTVEIERNGQTKSGVVTLVGFGIDWDTATQTVESSSSVAHVPFTAADTAGSLTAKLVTALTAAGWSVTMDGPSKLVVSTNRHGDDVYSLWTSIDYAAEVGGDDIEDHWIFSVK